MEAREGSCIQESAGSRLWLKALVPTNMSPLKRRDLFLKGLEYSCGAICLDFTLMLRKPLTVDSGMAFAFS